VNTPVEPTLAAAAGEPEPGFGFPKASRLRRRHEFVAVQKRGVRVTAPHFTFLLVASLVGASDAAARLGVTASRHVGNAVQRNRAKRLAREVFRHHLGWLPAGCDVVVVLRAGAPRLTLEQLTHEWQQARGSLQRQATRVLAASDLTISNRRPDPGSTRPKTRPRSNGKRP